MRHASFLVLPSVWYEMFPMVIPEAFSASLPIIVSRLAGLQSLVRDGETGLHFNPGDPEDLARKVRWAAEHSREMERMGANARREYETLYTPEKNYERLMAIYEDVLGCRERQRA
jgi:glycosyltransferase involved in cell wall biosynthesis